MDKGRSIADIFSISNEFKFMFLSVDYIIINLASHHFEMNKCSCVP